MKKGFSIGQMVFLIVAAIVVFKVIVPKFMNKTGGGIAIYQAASELKTGVDDIRSYYFRNGKFTNIGIMTISAGFEDKDTSFDFDKPVRYGVNEKGVMNYCVEVVAKQENGGEYIYVNNTSNNSEACKEFRNHSIVQDLRKVNLAYN